jgi:hypothetical protein
MYAEGEPKGSIAAMHEPVTAGTGSFQLPPAVGMTQPTATTSPTEGESTGSIAEGQVPGQPERGGTAVFPRSR